MDTLNRIWNIAYRIVGILFLPLIPAMFAGFIIYLMPESPWVRYPLMIFLVLLCGLIGYGTAKEVIKDIIEQEFLSGERPWMRYFYLLEALVCSACTALIMIFFIQNPDGTEHRAHIYVAAEDMVKKDVEIGKPFTAECNGHTCTVTPDSAGIYVLNITTDTLFLTGISYTTGERDVKAIVPPDSLVYTGYIIDDYRYIPTQSRKEYRIILKSKYSYK